MTTNNTFYKELARLEKERDEARDALKVMELRWLSAEDQLTELRKRMNSLERLKDLWTEVMRGGGGGS